MINNKTILGVVILFVVGLAVGYYLSIEQRDETTDTPVDSVTESPDENTSWNTSDKGGVTFQYPSDLNTKYIQAFDWPPQAQVLNQPFNCTEAGTETDRTGKTEQRTIGGQTFCITEKSEGAAGSVYSQFAYAFSKNEKTVILTFSIRAPQCANYGEPQKTECDNERSSIDLDDIVGRISQTLRIK